MIVLLCCWSEVVGKLSGAGQADISGCRGNGPLTGCWTALGRSLSTGQRLTTARSDDSVVPRYPGRLGKARVVPSRMAWRLLIRTVLDPGCMILIHCWLRKYLRELKLSDSHHSVRLLKGLCKSRAPYHCSGMTWLPDYGWLLLRVPLSRQARRPRVASLRREQLITIIVDLPDSRNWIHHKARSGTHTMPKVYIRTLSFSQLHLSSSYIESCGRLKEQICRRALSSMHIFVALNGRCSPCVAGHTCWTGLKLFVSIRPGAVLDVARLAAGP